MVTEPRPGGQRTPLQEFESLYIGVAKPAAVVRVLRLSRGRSTQLAIATGYNKFTHHDGSYHLAVESKLNKHEVER